MNTEGTCRANSLGSGGRGYIPRSPPAGKKNKTSTGAAGKRQTRPVCSEGHCHHNALSLWASLPFVCRLSKPVEPQIFPTPPAGRGTLLAPFNNQQRDHYTKTPWLHGQDTGRLYRQKVRCTHPEPKHPATTTPPPAPAPPAPPTHLRPTTTALISFLPLVSRVGLLFGYHACGNVSRPGLWAKKQNF